VYNQNNKADMATVQTNGASKKTRTTALPASLVRITIAVLLRNTARERIMTATH